jgi:hypothetical protein
MRDAGGGIDVLARDRGVVIPGWPTRIATRLGQLVPRRVLLPLLARQHGLNRGHP